MTKEILDQNYQRRLCEWKEWLERKEEDFHCPNEQAKKERWINVIMTKQHDDKVLGQ